MTYFLPIGHYGDNMILIDSRETRSTIPKILDSLKVQTRIQKLDIGDYLVVGHKTLCISRKSASDYISSINSNHLSNELFQISSKYDHCLLAIHGSIEDALIYRKMKRNSYFNYLASCYIKTSSEGKSSPISIFHFSTDYDFCCFLKTLDDNITTGDLHRDLETTPLKKSKLSITKQKIQTVSSFPNLGGNRSKILLKKYKSLKNLINTTEKDISSIKGFGKKISSDLVEYFNNEECD